MFITGLVGLCGLVAWGSGIDPGVPPVGGLLVAWWVGAGGDFLLSFCFLLPSFGGFCNELFPFYRSFFEFMLIIERVYLLLLSRGSLFFHLWRPCKVFIP